MTLTVNGRLVEVPPSLARRRLLDLLREELDLTGAKNGCGVGMCGTCTVLVDGAVKRACLMTVEAAAGKDVLTIEGLAPADGTLHPLQQAFVDAGAIQCGFCTPGMVMAAHGLLLKNPRPTRVEIRKALHGNLCRCTGYQQIVDAVEQAAAAYPDKA